MDDLRLIGVDEDGHHLLLSDGDGARYRLPLDEPLRAAARHDRPRLGQLQIEMGGTLRPREVQALIRRGLSTEEVAERAGWTVEKVRKFEVPILAERIHVAERARACAVGTRGTGPLSLEERVLERLRERGVERDHIDWDSARDEDGVWHLTMTFAAGGRRRTATWHYEPLGGSVAPTDDEARWLSEEATGGVIPAPHRAPPGEGLDVYDVDADGGLEAVPRVREPHEPIDLMAAMREHSARGRRGRRRSSPSHTPGDDHPRDDALPLEELAIDPSELPPPPPARGDHPVEARLGAVEEAEEPEQESDDRDHEADATASETVSGRPATRGEHHVDRGDDDEGRPTAPRRAAAGRKGRPSVPSWDDIVFGTKGSGPA
jgi:hypothetical protein